MCGGRRAGGQRGQSLIEFALVAPLLIGLVFGVFDLGRGMSANVTVSNSAREGARYLATHTVALQSPSGPLPAGRGRFGTACYGTGSTPAAPAADSAQGAAWRQLADASLALTAVTMTVHYYNAQNDPANAGSQAADVITCSAGAVAESAPGYKPNTGDWVQFEVQYHYTPATPLITVWLRYVTLDETATMVLE